MAHSSLLRHLFGFARFLVTGSFETPALAIAQARPVS